MKTITRIFLFVALMAFALFDVSAQQTTLTPTKIEYELIRFNDAGGSNNPYANEVLKISLFAVNNGQPISLAALKGEIPTFTGFVNSNIGSYWGKENIVIDSSNHPNGIATGETISYTVYGYFNSMGTKTITGTLGSSVSKTVTVANDPGCYDSDSGKSEYIYGWTYGGIATSTGPSTDKNRVGDVCDGSSVTEMFCENGLRYAESISCPNGCSNGACIKETLTDCESLINEADTREFFSVCLESDYSNSFTGVCFNKYSKEFQGCGKKEDCVVNNMNAGSNLFCEIPSWLCTETDTKDDFYVRGESKGRKKGSDIQRTVMDTCSGNTVNEYYCEEGYLLQKSSACPNGCANGACKDPDGVAWYPMAKEYYDPSTFVEGSNGQIQAMWAKTCSDVCENKGLTATPSCSVWNNAYGPGHCRKTVSPNGKVASAGPSCEETDMTSIIGQDYCCCKKDTQSECIDSDGGKDYFIRGKLTYETFVDYDNCLECLDTGCKSNDNCIGEHCFINEGFCDSTKNYNGMPLWFDQSFNCPNGCKDGACQKPTACTEEYAPVCGMPPMPVCPPGAYCKMVVPVPKTYSNRCTMESEGATFLYDGECYDASACADSDGANQYVKGDVKVCDFRTAEEPGSAPIGCALHTDVCTEPNQVLEYSCQDDEMKADYITCNNGCNDGACVNANCPQYSPPSPDFCLDGNIVSGGYDENGCPQPPTCERYECQEDSDCEMYFSSCSCSWVCGKVEENRMDCARACPSGEATQPELAPDCGCTDGMCTQRIKERCQFSSGVDCIDKAQLCADTKTMTIALRNNVGFTIEVNDLSVRTMLGEYTCNDNENIALGAGSDFRILPVKIENNQKFLVRFTGCDLSEGNSAELNVELDYVNTETGLNHRVAGEVDGVSEICDGSVSCQDHGEMCGGIAGFQCCDGLVCEMEGNYPDAAGTCVRKTTDCKPVCQSIGTKSEGWYDSCTGEFIRWDRCGSKDCEGCYSNNKCLPYGTRLSSSEGIDAPVYCSIESDFIQQSEDGGDCQNNYECISNSCASGRCTDLGKEMQETRNMIQRFWDWLKGVF